MTDKEQTQGLEEMATELVRRMSVVALSAKDGRVVETVVPHVVTALRQAQADALERAARIADAEDIKWNAIAYDHRQAGRDDNSACNRASGAAHIATAIRAMKEG